MKKIFSAALALVCIWFATPAHANCNLFDINNPVAGTGYNVTKNGNNIVAVAKSGTSSASRIMFFVPVSHFKPNTRYYISTKADKEFYATYLAIGIAQPNSGSDGLADYGRINGKENNGFSGTFKITDIGVNQEYVSFYYYLGEQPEGTQITISDIMITEGSTAPTAYTPYNPLCATCDGTVVSGQWNQLVQNGNFADGVNNWISETSVVANAENGVLSVTYQSGGDRGVGQVVEISSGHKVFVSFDVDSYTGESYIGVFRGDGASMFRSVGDAVKINRTGHYEQVKTLNALSAGYGYYAAGAGRPVGEGAKVSFSNLNVIDLTEMFGAGNEPSTEQEAKAAIAQRANELGISATNGYYAYHANENVSSCISKIKIATTKYNETKFSPLNTALANAISVVDTVVSNTITQAGRIATLQAQKQTRPNDIADDNEKCPAGKKCLLVTDTSGVPHWYEICSSAHCLPEGYTELEYIESTGTQYIDTNITGSTNAIIDMQGTPRTDDTIVFMLAPINATAYQNGFGQYKGLIAGANNIDIVTRRVYNVSYTSSSMTVNGTTISYYIANNVNLALFGSTATNRRIRDAKLYSAKIYNNDTLLRNFVPAKNSAGVIGMYDTVSGTFFENKGTGEFIAGDPVVE